MNDKKVNKCCSTCEYNLGDICANDDTDKGYGWEIDDYDKERQCWEISLNYSIELTKHLSDVEKNEYVNSHKYNADDLVKKIESGKWK